MTTQKTFRPTLSKEELNDLEAENYQGEIRIVNTLNEAIEACLFLSQQDIVGFDTETKPSFVKGEVHKVALMQISNGPVCFLFRLNKIGIPECLADLLQSKKVLKIGLSTKDDFRALTILRKDFKAVNFIELQNFVPNFGIQEMSLSKIYAILFGKRISKGQRLSNWEADELLIKQQQYAALDAYATRRIYMELKENM